MPCSRSARVSDLSSEELTKMMAKVARNFRDPSGILKCKVKDVSHGASNIVYRLKFSDGKKWALKVPLASHGKGICSCWAFGEQRFRLRSEVLTMKVIRRRTSIPIPEVYDFGTGFDNEFGFPFILMDYLSGRTATELWADTDSSSKTHREARATFLKSLAGCVMQLNLFEFDDMGYPDFNEDDQLSGLKALSDYPLYLSRTGRPLALSTSDPVRNAILGKLARGLPSHVDDTLEGAARYLRKVLQWTPVTPNEIRDGRKPFVLAHPDLDLQNILVDNDSRVCGLIDWDGIRAVPRCVGNETYPLWLVEDCSNPRSREPFKDVEFCRGMWEDLVAEHFPTAAQCDAARVQTRNSAVLHLFRYANIGDLDLLMDLAGGVAERSLKGVSRLEWKSRGDYQLALRDSAGIFKKVSIEDVFVDITLGKLTSGQWDLLEREFHRLIWAPNW